MKKIMSFVIFAAALIWTWNLIHSSNGISFETHSGIQMQLAKVIESALAKVKPAATEFKIQKIWTETLTDTKVRAVFSYSFLETTDNNEKTEQNVEGEAVLHREPTENAQNENWIIQSVKTTAGKVIFNEGSVVTPE